VKQSHNNCIVSKRGELRLAIRRQDALERDLREMHSAGCATISLHPNHSLHVKRFLSARFAYATDKPRPVPEVGDNDGRCVLCFCKERGQIYSWCPV
jgi:hypothetical protein